MKILGFPQMAGTSDVSKVDWRRRCWRGYYGRLHCRRWRTW